MRLKLNGYRREQTVQFSQPFCSNNYFSCNNYKTIYQTIHIDSMYTKLLYALSEKIFKK